ncbi:ubiquitin carboxyl-terminal hydrolase 5, partial [Lynx pardinus]
GIRASTRERLNLRVGVLGEEDFGILWVLGHSLFPRTTRFASFPDYLVIQIKKFTFGLDWVPKKLDVSIEMPEELDISQLRGTGLQPGEEELPDIAPPLVTPDEPKGSLGFYGNEDEDSFCSPHFSSPTC